MHLYASEDYKNNTSSYDNMDILWQSASIIEHTFVIGAASELRVRFRASKPQSSFPTDRSKAVLLLQFFFVCASVISYMALALS